MVPLTYEENESYKNIKVCYICKKGFITDDANKEYHKYEILIILQENIEELLIIRAIGIIK